jgi:hypothetical protein
MEPEIVVWDWKEQPDWMKIDAVLEQFQYPSIRLVDNTHCDVNGCSYRRTPSKSGYGAGYL